MKGEQQRMHAYMRSSLVCVSDRDQLREASVYMLYEYTHVVPVPLWPTIRMQFIFARPNLHCAVGRRLAVLCRCSTLADALPLYCFGGCFAAVAVGESSLRADALPPILVGRVDALPPCLCCGSSRLWRCSFFCRFSCWLVRRRSWLGS